MRRMDLSFFNLHDQMHLISSHYPYNLQYFNRIRGKTTLKKSFKLLSLKIKIVCLIVF